MFVLGTSRGNGALDRGETSPSVQGWVKFGTWFIALYCDFAEERI